MLHPLASALPSASSSSVHNHGWWEDDFFVYFKDLGLQIMVKSRFKVFSTLKNYLVELMNIMSIAKS